MRTEPSYHPDAGALSFNVKTLGLSWADGGTDDQREVAWELAQRQWWSDAKLLAIKHGFTDVECHGRSGGWLTPVPGIYSCDADPDPCDTDPDPDGFAADMVRIRAFGVELNALFNQAPEYFNRVLTDVLARDADREIEEAAAVARNVARGEAFTKLIALANAVTDCDTTSDCLKRQARDALPCCPKGSIHGRARQSFQAARGRVHRGGATDRRPPVPCRRRRLSQHTDRRGTDMSLRDNPMAANVARVLDFPGFYESVLSEALDDAERNMVEALIENYDLPDEPDPYEACYDASTYATGFRMIAKDYVDWLNHVLDGTGIVLAYESMKSPREYNFSTDALFVTVNDPKLVLLRTRPSNLNTVAAEFFTSRPGFHSFYSPLVDTWGEITEWDHNQLGALLTACLRQVAEDKGLDQNDMLEYMHEDFDAAVDAQTDFTKLYAALGIKE